MMICKAIIDQSGAIYMLNGHEESIGATEELEYAKKYNKKVLSDNM